MDYRAELLERCATQRADLGQLIEPFQAGVVSADKAIEWLRRRALHPVAIGAGIVLFLALGRARSWRLIGTLGLVPPILQAAAVVVTALQRRRSAQDRDQAL
jgi:hypothetical protein